MYNWQFVMIRKWFNSLFPSKTLKTDKNNKIKTCAEQGKNLLCLSKLNEQGFLVVFITMCVCKKLQTHGSKKYYTV